jgi:hypothetical protein
MVPIAALVAALTAAADPGVGSRLREQHHRQRSIV